MASSAIKHSVNVASVSTAIVPQVYQVPNQFDEFGYLLSEKRLPGISNSQYKRVLNNIFAARANSTYRGLINGIARDLGLSISTKAVINPRLTDDGSFLAADPYIRFDGAWLYLWSDYSGGILDYQIDRSIPGNLYSSLGSLLDFINTTTYFCAELKDGASINDLSLTIINQSNRGLVENETVPITTRFQLANTRPVRDSVFFTDRNVFRTEVADSSLVVSPGQYSINYTSGIVSVYTLPNTDTLARYEYYCYPFAVVSSPIILQSPVDLNMSNVYFQSLGTLDVIGVPTAEGVNLINELLSVNGGMYFGV